MTTPAPAAPVTAPPPYLRQVSDAMDNFQGAELAARVNELHERAMAPLHDQMRGLQEANARLTQAQSLEYQLRVAALDTVQHLVRRAADATAHNVFLEAMLGEAARLAHEAGDAPSVATDKLRLALAARQGSQRAFQPSVLAFQPSNQFRIGYFQTRDQAVWREFPFAGYALYDGHPDQQPTQQLAFLSDGNVMVRAQLLSRWGLHMVSVE